MRGELLFEEEINDGFIRNYHITKYSSGIILLTINTEERWADYGVIYSVDGLKISIDYKNYELDRPHSMNITDLKFQKPSETIELQSQNKDQISIYYIPYELLDINVKR